jgi:hypothetical protein
MAHIPNLRKRLRSTLKKAQLLQPESSSRFEDMRIYEATINLFSIPFDVNV